MYIQFWLTTLNRTRRKVHAVCGDANPRRLETQTCSGWRHTMDQPLNQVSRKYRFTFSFVSAIYKWGGEFFTENYIMWHPLHSGIIFDPQGIIARIAFFCTKFEHCSCIRCTDMKKASKVRNDDPMPLDTTFWIQNQYASRTTTGSSFKSFRLGVFVLLC